MSNFIRQNEVNMANELLKVEQPLLESSNEIDKVPCFTKNRSFSSNQNYRDEDRFSSSRILSDGELQLTDPRSAKILDKLVEEVQKCSILAP